MHATRNGTYFGPFWGLIEDTQTKCVEKQELTDIKMVLLYFFDKHI